MSFDLEIIDTGMIGPNARETYFDILTNGSLISPINTNLVSQKLDRRGSGLGIAPKIAAVDPINLIKPIKEHGLQQAIFNDSLETEVIGHWNLSRVEFYLNQLEKMSDHWEFFGTKTQIRLDANLSKNEIDEQAFLYILFQEARQKLRRKNFFIEPFFRADEIREGSLIFDIFFGAATLAGGFAAYPKVKAGFLEAAKDTRKLKTVFQRTLENKKVFKK